MRRGEVLALLCRGGVHSLKERISLRGEMPEERRSRERKEVRVSKSSWLRESHRQTLMA